MVSNNTIFDMNRVLNGLGSAVYMTMERRSVLAGGILFAAGCSKPLTGVGEQEPPGVVEAVLLEDPPADAEITPSDDDDRLVDVEVIQVLVRKASNPSERTTV